MAPALDTVHGLSDNEQRKVVLHRTTPYAHRFLIARRNERFHDFAGAQISAPDTAQIDLDQNLVWSRRRTRLVL
jgi:hypothetical protein